MISLKKYNFPPITLQFEEVKPQEVRFRLFEIKEAMEREPDIYFGEIGEIMLAKVLERMGIAEFTKIAKANKVVSMLADRMLNNVNKRFRHKGQFLVRYLIDVEMNETRNIGRFTRGMPKMCARTSESPGLFKFPYASHLVFYHHSNGEWHWPIGKDSFLLEPFHGEKTTDERIEVFTRKFSYDFVTINILKKKTGVMPTNDHLLAAIRVARGDALIFPNQQNIIPILEINSTFKHLIAPKGLRVTVPVGSVWMRFERVTTIFHLEEENEKPVVEPFIRILETIFEEWKQNEIRLKQLEVQFHKVKYQWNARDKTIQKIAGRGPSSEPLLMLNGLGVFMSLTNYQREHLNRYICYLSTETNGKKRHCLICEHYNEFYFLDISDCEGECEQCPGGYICLTKMQRFVEAMGGIPTQGKKINYKLIAGKWMMLSAEEMREPLLEELGLMILEELNIPYYSHLLAIGMAKEEDVEKEKPIRFLYKFKPPYENNPPLPWLIEP